MSTAQDPTCKALCYPFLATKNDMANGRNIVDEFASREDVAHFARCVPYDEIKGQDYNLSVSSYVEQEDTREVIDIAKLNAELEEIVAREQVLRDEIAKIIAELEG